MDDATIPPDRVLLTPDGGLPSGNYPRGKLVPYVREDLTGWRDIESDPPPDGGEMFVAIKLVEGDSFSNGKLYTTDPRLVWYSGGSLVRWPHNDPPTHWMFIPKASEVRA